MNMPRIGVHAQFLRGRQVLMADDDPVNRVLGETLLQQLDLVVTMVDDGRQAVDLVSAHAPGHFGALLMDLQMPVMDGLEATRVLRRLPQGERLPILAATAAAQSDDLAVCLAAGMDGHVNKPLVLVELSLALVRVMGLECQAAAPLVPDVVSPDWLLWERFVASQSGAGDELAALLASGRLDEAERRVQDLRDTFDHVDAPRLASACAALDAALRARRPSEHALQAVRESLSARCAWLKQQLRARVG